MSKRYARTGRRRQRLFTRLSMGASRVSGTPAAFIGAAAAVLLWAASGPLFHFGDTWQLVINTATTIVTFLMVFLIQSTQNRDTEAIHIKLDELIQAVQGANTALLDLEQLDEKVLRRIKRTYMEKAAEARRHLDVPDDA
jgi:low affinity Fe/Cu permease